MDKVSFQDAKAALSIPPSPVSQDSEVEEVGEAIMVEEAMAAKAGPKEAPKVCPVQTSLPTTC